MCSKLVSAIIASLDKETIETGLYFWSFGRERLENFVTCQSVRVANGGQT